MPTGITDDVGTIRLRRRWQGNRHVEIRFIKIRNGPPIAGRWIPLARYTWEEMNGPVPAGMRVVHVDGNTLNDNPNNYATMASGEFIRHHHALSPKMSKSNRNAIRKITSIRNTEQAAVRRFLEWLPSYWYPVDHVAMVIHNTPYKSRRHLYEDWGVAVALNGIIPNGTSLPVVAIRGAQLRQPEFCHYKKRGNEPCRKRTKK